MLFEKSIKTTSKYKTVKTRYKTLLLCKRFLQFLFFVYTDAMGEYWEYPKSLDFKIKQMRFNALNDEKAKGRDILISAYVRQKKQVELCKFILFFYIFYIFCIFF